mgnify:CR=1 FL=1
MFAKFFRMPTIVNGVWSSFSDDFLFAANKIAEYEYTKRFVRPGDFSMVLPFDEGTLKKLMLNGIIYFDSDWLWIQNLSYDGRRIELSGKDCKGFLDTRVTLFNFDEEIPGTQGYDVAEGTTQACMRHYVENNAVYGICQAGRELPIVNFSGDIGLSSDSYMARLEYLSDIAAKMCENAGIGYDVQGILRDRGFRMTTIKGVNRGFLQSDRPRVIFSARRRNVISQQFEHGVDDLYNVVYGVDSNEDVGAAYRDGITSDVGLKRRECTTSISEVTIADPMFEKYALNAISDNVESHSCTTDAAVISGYGSKYNIGDIVAVQDIFTKNIEDVQITEVTKSCRQGQQSLSLTFGTPKQKPLQKIVNDFLSGTARRR